MAIWKLTLKLALNTILSINENKVSCLMNVMYNIHCIKCARIRVFTDPHSPVLSLYGRARVSENPYSHIFYAVGKENSDRNK